MTEQAAIATAIVATGLTLVTVYWLMAYVWLRRQIGRMQAMLALAIGVSVMHVTTGPFFVSYHWSLLDGCFALAGLLLLERVTPMRLRWLLVLIAVATLNRETAIVIAIWGAARTVQSRRYIGYGVLGLVVWVAIYAAIRVGVDAPPRVDNWELTRIFQINMTFSVLPHLIFYLGAGWVLALRGLLMDAERRWMAMGVAAMLGLFFLFAIWGETRVLYPVLPALLLWVVSPANAVSD